MIRVFRDVSVSTQAWVHIRAQRFMNGGLASASAGYSNERTLFTRVEEGRSVRITVAGDFGSSAVVAIGICPDASEGAYVNLYSVSAAFSSVEPIPIGHSLVFNVASASAAFSVNAYVG